MVFRVEFTDLEMTCVFSSLHVLSVEVFTLLCIKLIAVWQQGKLMCSVQKRFFKLTLDVFRLLSK